MTLLLIALGTFAGSVLLAAWSASTGMWPPAALFALFSLLAATVFVMQALAMRWRRHHAG